MNYFKQLLTIVIITFITLTSCDDKSTTPINNNNSVKDFFPLTVGSWWKYSREFFNKEGDSTRPTKYDSLYVNLKTTLNNKEVFQVLKYDIDAAGNIDTSFNGKYYTDTIYYGFENSRLIKYNTQTNFANYPDAVILDIESNSWTRLEYKGKATHSNGNKAEVEIQEYCQKGPTNSAQYLDKEYSCFEAVMNSVTKSSHTFSDHPYKMHELANESTQYLTGIGLIYKKVKMEFLIQKSNNVLELKLMDYFIN